MELDLATGAKNKICFYRYTNQRRKAQEDILFLVSNTCRLVTKEKEKTEVFNNFFCLSLHR